MERYLYEPLKKDLARKMAILTGPRQIGKTWLARELMKEYQTPQYLNFDSVDDARIIQTRSWPLDADMLVFDEIHKMKGWKRYVKGVFDTRAAGQALLLTGSSRLDTFRQTGSLLQDAIFTSASIPSLSGNSGTR